MEEHFEEQLLRCLREQIKSVASQNAINIVRQIN
jgi:hypothetical protein